MKNNSENEERIKSFYRELDYDLIILLIISTILNLSYQNPIIYEDSIITLKVSSIGENKIFGDGTEFTKPNEVWIDTDKKVDLEKNYYDFPTNIIKLRWTEEITGCESMFLECKTIVEIKFIKFDAKKCLSTFHMFRDCQSLISLDLSVLLLVN